MAVQDPQYPARRFWEKDTEQKHIRLTHADRDAVGEVLREAYSKGQLDDEEFEERIDLAMRARIGADLAPLTEDLRVSPTDEQAGAVPTHEGGNRRAGNKEPLPSTPAEQVVAAVGHAGNYFVPVLAPLVLFLLSDKISPYVRRQAMESLNFQLFCIIAGAASVLLFWLALPVAVLIYCVLGWLVLPAVAGVASLMGKNWRYPMFFRLLKDS